MGAARRRALWARRLDASRRCSALSSPCGLRGNLPSRADLSTTEKEMSCMEQSGILLTPPEYVISDVEIAKYLSTLSDAECTEIGINPNYGGHQIESEIRHGVHEMCSFNEADIMNLLDLIEEQPETKREQFKQMLIKAGGDLKQLVANAGGVYNIMCAVVGF